jgi:hypothetical protein
VVSPLQLIAIAKPSWPGDRRLETLAQEGEDPPSLGLWVSSARLKEMVSAKTLSVEKVASAVMDPKAVANLASPQCPLGQGAASVRS